MLQMPYHPASDFCWLNQESVAPGWWLVREGFVPQRPAIAEQSREFYRNHHHFSAIWAPAQLLELFRHYLHLNTEVNTGHHISCAARSTLSHAYCNRPPITPPTQSRTLFNRPPARPPHIATGSTRTARSTNGSRRRRQGGGRCARWCRTSLPRLRTSTSTRLCSQIIPELAPEVRGLRPWTLNASQIVHANEPSTLNPRPKNFQP